MNAENQIIQMKFKSILTLFLFITITASHAQENTVPQPDFINVPAYYIKGSDKLMNLSKETIGMAGKIGKALYELQGTQSSVRIKSADDYVFIIKAGDMDPSTITTFYKMTATKKTRQAEMTNSGLTSGTMDTKDVLKYNLVKVADKVYSIVPETKLVAGEYMFVVGGTPYTFGIE